MDTLPLTFESVILECVACMQSFHQTILLMRGKFLLSTKNLVIISSDELLIFSVSIHDPVCSSYISTKLLTIIIFLRTEAKPSGGVSSSSTP